jgi:hypothetical protein
MHNFMKTSLAILLLVMSTGIVCSAPKKQTVIKDWQAQAKVRKLSARDIEQLNRDKLIITADPIKYLWEPYLESPLPVFITADSIINAYRDLHDAAIMRIEDLNTLALPGILTGIWRNLEADAAATNQSLLMVAARLRARIVVGTALRLLDQPADTRDPTIATIIEQEVQKIIAATAEMKPAWLGPPDEGFVALDYSRFKPRGLYTDSPRLARYFRTVSWLQAIPFRIANDEELAAILLASAALENVSGAQKCFRWFCQFLGEADTWDLLDARTFAETIQPGESIVLSKNVLAQLRTKLQNQAAANSNKFKIYDQIRLTDNSSIARSFRMIAACQTPESLLFQKMRHAIPHYRPSGLAVAAAFDSELARQCLLRASNGVVLAQMIGEAKALFHEQSFYNQYLACLATLSGALDSRAPAFMTNAAWKAKSLQSTLAGWAQLRHAWLLRLSEVGEEEDGYSAPPGFVESVPAFFGNMARLCAAMRKSLAQAGAFACNYSIFAQDVRDTICVVEGMAWSNNYETLCEICPDDQRRLLENTEQYASLMDVWFPDKDSRAKCLRRLKVLAEKLAGTAAPKEVEPEEMQGFFTSSERDWSNLENVCSVLNAIATRQLQGKELTTKDKRFMNIYGETLCAADCSVSDDPSPCIADVYCNRQPKGYIYAATGRPRLIYVLHPWQGREVLCRGAVLSYYEFSHPTRLNDADWRALLDANDCPAPPAWITPFTTTNQTVLMSDSDREEQQSATH